MTRLDEALAAERVIISIDLNPENSTKTGYDLNVLEGGTGEESTV